jgi:hypothetical protein
MKAAILQFYVSKHVMRKGNHDKEPPTNVSRIMVRGLKEYPQLILELGEKLEGDEINVITSYLNQLSLTIEKWKLMVETLLKASLDGKSLNKIQDEGAKMLCYSCIHEFIEEMYGRKEGGKQNARVGTEVIDTNTNTGANVTGGEDKSINLPIDDTKETSN